MEATEPSHNGGATFHFTVDGEPLTTQEHDLTPRQILSLAHIDESNHFLTLIEGRNQRSYQSEPDTTIHMHEGMVFISSNSGPTPVS